MRARNLHKLVTNGNGNESNVIGGFITIIGFIAIIALLVAPFL